MCTLWVREESPQSRVYLKSLGWFSFVLVGSQDGIHCRFRPILKGLFSVIYLTHDYCHSSFSNRKDGGVGVSFESIKFTTFIIYVINQIANNSSFHEVMCLRLTAHAHAFILLRQSYLIDAFFNGHKANLTNIFQSVTRLHCRSSNEIENHLTQQLNKYRL